MAVSLAWLSAGSEKVEMQHGTLERWREKVCCSTGLVFFLISKLRQREKEHGTVRDPALP